MTKQAKPVMLDKDGYLTINPDGIQLPAASADTAGVVKVGDGLAIDESGVLSASGDEKTIVKLYVSEGIPYSSFDKKKTFTVSSSDYVIRDVYDAILAGKPVECQVIHAGNEYTPDSVVVLDLAFYEANAESQVQNGAPCFATLVFSKPVSNTVSDVLFQANYSYYDDSFDVIMSLIENKTDAS